MQLTHFKKILLSSFIATFAFTSTPSLSFANTLGAPPVIIIKPHPVQLNAASWLLMDFETCLLLPPTDGTGLTLLLPSLGLQADRS